MKKKDREKGCKDRRGVTRRGFLQLMGAGAVASASVGKLSAQPAAEVMEPGAADRAPLVAALRDPRKTGIDRDESGL
jgi:hypothetical protein